MCCFVNLILQNENICSIKTTEHSLNKCTSQQIPGATGFKTGWFLFLLPNYHLHVKFLFEIIKIPIWNFLGGCKYDIFHRFPIIG